MENGKKNFNNSSTMMNKIFEFIEAKKLFNLKTIISKFLYTQNHLFMQLYFLKMI